jgi:hypothetical protein
MLLRKYSNHLQLPLLTLVELATVAASQYFWWAPGWYPLWNLPWASLSSPIHLILAIMSLTPGSINPEVHSIFAFYDLGVLAVQTCLHIGVMSPNILDTPLPDDVAEYTKIALFSLLMLVSACRYAWTPVSGSLVYQVSNMAQAQLSHQHAIQHLLQRVSATTQQGVGAGAYTMEHSPLQVQQQPLQQQMPSLFVGMQPGPIGYSTPMQLGSGTRRGWN